MGILDFLKQPDVMIVQALLLKFRTVNMDVLPLYIVLMMFLPLILWLMQRKADITLALAVILYMEANGRLSYRAPLHNWTCSLRRFIVKLSALGE